jgi:hypothetical protein
VGWPPKVGEVLPRAADAWCVEEKWADWILADGGHGPEWSRVFRVRHSEWQRVWEAIAAAVIGASIQTVRDLRTAGVTCGVPLDLAIEGRAAAVATAWHYADEATAPRLVTAYPKPYNRGHGSST